nr:hypothetical protein [uncultured archaeon]
MDILSVGSATVDVFVHTKESHFNPKSRKIKLDIGSKVLVDHIFHATGGGGTNTAVAFSRLGLKAGFLGKLGKDEAARMIIDEMKEERVNTSLVSRSDVQTGYSVILDAAKEDHVILCFKGANDEFKATDIHESRMKAGWFYIATMMGDAYKAIEKLVEYAAANEVKVAFNPSTYLASKGPKYLEKVLRHVTVLVLNQDEARLIIGKKKVKELAVKLRELGPKIVVITDGPGEIVAYNGTIFYSAKPNKVKIVETTGSGDAFASGFVAGIIKTEDVEFALQLGMANAENVIQALGAKNNLLRLGQALKYMRKHRVSVKKSVK